MGALLAVLLAAQSGSAEPTQPATLDVDVLATCMVDKSTDAHTAPLRALLIAALQDDVPAMQKAFAAFGAALISLAMMECDVGLSQLDDPAFEAASEKYGEVIGDRLISVPLSKLK